MQHHTELLQKLESWWQNLQKAIQNNEGESMCEASRMVLSICSILRVYFPDLYQPEYSDKSILLFKNAIVSLDKMIEEEKDPDDYLKLYRTNITKRIGTLENLEAEVKVAIST